MPGPSGSQEEISSAVTLNATKTVQDSITQQPLTLFQVNKGRSTEESHRYDRLMEYVVYKITQQC